MRQMSMTGLRSRQKSLPNLPMHTKDSPSKAILLSSFLTGNSHFLTPFRSNRLHPEPDGVKRRQKHECKDSSDGRSTVKRVCHRDPNDQELERNDSIHLGQPGRNAHTCPLASHFSTPI